LPEKKQKIS